MKHLLMTATKRPAIFLMLLCLYLANNIMVPVHALSHIHEHHDTELANCDVYHAMPSIAVCYDNAGTVSPLAFRSVNSSYTAFQIRPSSVTTTNIRAPPPLFFI